MKTSIILLVASLIVALGGWIITLDTWADALKTVAMGGLLMNLAGVVLAWLGKSPIKSNLGGSQK